MVLVKLHNLESEWGGEGVCNSNVHTDYHEHLSLGSRARVHSSHRLGYKVIDNMIFAS